MTKPITWIPLSLFGAFLYGTFSFMLSFVDKKIKNSESAQFGYGMILAMGSGIIALIVYLAWKHKEPKTAKMLEGNMNWKIIIITLLFSVMITPAHTLVINQGGSVGQQMMYSLAIIPVLVGSRYFFKEKLNTKQWIGLVFAGIGAYLMSGKTTESMTS